MLALAADGAPEGLWLRADRQTGGRGRLGRTWVSPSGNLYASTLVRVRPGDPPPATLAMVAAVALDEVVAPLVAGAAAPRPVHELEAGHAREVASVRIKWPNDVLVGDAKLSGILLERSGDAVVIGLGVNVAYHPEGLGRATTSLAQEGVAIAPPALLEALAPAFARWVEIWRGGLSALLARWLARAHPVGTPLSATLPDGDIRSGTFAGLNADGALLLRGADGATEVIHAADVFLV
ncbi:biotin--[acetyl-CoA-carboxylase] ligase [Sphingomonas aracearum]|uniref:biotin--[biotin carboxyl-carrier protein] ligase n=1 Tax=Sphingomonas aracearum TaxID=2283317 RepID=A0A369VY77_9SPHN|nr:biotin--[acetyl-CoA-carboxylase] ligase [Sphingomonas aracearum]RDE06080.1 biotin--[acetyl-CoA-carboxylase] ligase [Sphingomonas aracearum]